MVSKSTWKNELVMRELESEGYGRGLYRWEWGYEDITNHSQAALHTYYICMPATGGYILDLFM